MLVTPFNYTKLNCLPIILAPLQLNPLLYVGIYIICNINYMKYWIGRNAGFCNKTIAT